MTRGGTTLLELLIAISLVTVCVVVLSLTFPKANTALLKSKQRWLAGGFAASQMDAIKQRPYAYITPNPTGDFTAFGISNCECKALSDAAMTGFSTPNAIMKDGNMTYTSRACVNLTQHNASPPPEWIANCPDPNNMAGTDHGLKSIRLRVFWTSGGATYHTDMESMVAR